MSDRPQDRRAHARVSTQLQGTIELSNGARREVLITDLSKGGAYVSDSGPEPVVFSELKLVIELPFGAWTTPIRVVRTVSAANAQQWGMPQGYGVELLSDPAQCARIIEQLTTGGAGPTQIDKRAETEIMKLSPRLGRGPYAMLMLEPDASVSDARRQGRALLDQLTELATRHVGNEPKKVLEALRSEAQSALAVLGDMRKRAGFDAESANFKGVARCLAAGLTPSELDLLRAEWLRTHGPEASKAHVHLVGANAARTRRDRTTEIAELERALKNDPLQLELHRRYWPLVTRTTPGNGVRSLGAA